MEWILPEYTPRTINRAGRILARPEPWVEEVDYEDALAVINNHRSSHGYPLLVFRVDLARRAKRIDQSAIVAQRTKRLSSIEAKLVRFSEMRLAQMQDIGGCRAVLRNARMVSRLAASYRKSSAKHKPAGLKDYIKNPRDSGYRGIHLIYRYHSNNEKKKVFNGLKIEIQLRSRLQHAWATAVETVDAFTGQALKGGRGKRKWRRFFALMGTYIAEKESKPLVPNTPTDRHELQGEIVHYVNELEVLTHLQSYRATLQTKPQDIPGGRADYYLVELDAHEWSVTIVGYREQRLKQAQNDYASTERRIAGQKGRDAVLVSVGSLAALKRAYPNYFADTDVFIQTLREAVGPGTPVR